MVQEMVYPLWDLGLDVGHATRSIQECITMAGDNIEVLTALLDARFVCGQSLLYSQLTETLRNAVGSITAHASPCRTRHTDPRAAATP